MIGNLLCIHAQALGVIRIEPVNLATLLQSLLSRFLSSGKNASPCVAVVLHVIEPTEARIVEYIYESCLEGATPAEIAAALTEQGIKSPMGNDLWSASTVRSILRNEKYCGDALMQKTYTKDFHTHKSVKNTDLNMYFKENHHTAIIKKEDWIKVQKLLSERHSTAKRATLRRLSNHFVAYRVKDGLFKGYLIMDSRWSFMERQEFMKNVDEAQNTMK